MGDFNIHSAQFFNLLDQHGLVQHMEESARKDDHILDRTITRSRIQQWAETLKCLILDSVITVVI